MDFKHELIEYRNQITPVNWIIHSGNSQYTAVLPHWHSSIEITYILSGEVGDFKINGISYTSVAGCIYIVNSAEVHSSISNNCSLLKALTIQFPYEFLSQLIPNFENKRFENFLFGEEREIMMLKETLDVFYNLVTREEDDFFRIDLNLLVYRIISILSKSFMKEYDTEINKNINVKKIEKVKPILQYIQENYTSDLSVSCLAEEFHISQSYLRKLFKNNLGMSVSNYIQSVRVSMAQKLLLFTDKPTHIISEIVGFPNEKSFRKSFEALYNTTPKRYQIEHRERKIAESKD